MGHMDVVGAAAAADDDINELNEKFHLDTLHNGLDGVQVGVGGL